MVETLPRSLTVAELKLLPVGTRVTVTEIRYDSARTPVTGCSWDYEIGGMRQGKKVLLSLPRHTHYRMLSGGKHFRFALTEGRGC